MSKLAAFLLFAWFAAVTAFILGAGAGSADVAYAAALPFAFSWGLLTLLDWIRSGFDHAVIGQRRIDRPGFFSVPLVLLSLPLQWLLLPPVGLPFGARLAIVVLIVAQFVAVDLRGWRFQTGSKTTCDDPATCGSEWCAGLDVGSPTVSVYCSRCGKTGTLDADASAELRAAAGAVS